MNPHIKGPWEATPALSNSWDIRDSDGRQMYFLGAGSSISKEVHKANALLIAAAPELLEALRQILHPDLRPDKSKSFARIAEEAIAKATGKEGA